MNNTVVLPSLIVLGVAFLSTCSADTDQDASNDSTAGDTETSSDTTDNQSIIPDGFDLQGHRGARGLRPESTLPAFEVALDLSLTTLEMDLHLTADHVLVIWHDASVQVDKCRIDPGATAPLPPDPAVLDADDATLYLANLTFAQLSKYRCDQNPTPEILPNQVNDPTDLAGDDYRISSLERLLDFVDTYATSSTKTTLQRANALGVNFNLETKRDPNSKETINDDFDGVNPGVFEKAIIALITARDLVDRTIIQSFDLRSLWAMRTLNSDIRLAVLSLFHDYDFTTLVANGAHIWSPHYLDATVEKIEAAQALGLLVIPYTVNETATMQTLIDQKIDGIITDRPDLTLTLF